LAVSVRGALDDRDTFATGAATRITLRTKSRSRSRQSRENEEGDYYPLDTPALHNGRWLALSRVRGAAVIDLTRSLSDDGDNDGDDASASRLLGASVTAVPQLRNVGDDAPASSSEPVELVFNDDHTSYYFASPHRAVEEAMSPSALWKMALATAKAPTVLAQVLPHPSGDDLSVITTDDDNNGNDKDDAVTTTSTDLTFATGDFADAGVRRGVTVGGGSALMTLMCVLFCVAR
jgi:hypothetical protein